MGKNKTGNNFPPYHSISLTLIEDIATNIKTIKRNILKNFAIQEFVKYCGADVINPIPPCTIKIKSLLGVPNALVVIYFDQNPLREPGPSLSGFARIPKMDESSLPIPIVYLIKTKSKTILEHETIHTCQYLHDNNYPLTRLQKEFILKTDLITGANILVETVGKEEMIDCIINATCYKTWIELEANYYTRGKASSRDWVFNAYKCSVPIGTFNRLSEVLQWEPEHMNLCRSRFIDFVNKMEKEVDWLRNVATDNNETCLYNLLLEMHDDFETDKMFCVLNNIMSS